MSAKVTVSHILVQHRHEAEDILARLNSGSSFEDLARKHSLCSSSTQGGLLGIIDPRRLDEDFRDALEILKPGQTSGCVRTRFGYHIIRRGDE